MTVKPVPDGYHTATPYLIINGAADAIEFYKQAFDAAEVMRLPGPAGKLGHAEIQIGDSRIMLADENPEMGFQGPKALGGTAVSICLYVEDVDAIFPQALDAGAKQLRPLQDQFYGDRSGTLEDPFGHVWTVATHKEDLTDEEIGKRMESMQGQTDAQ
jgi:PhnB protein